MGLLGGLKRSKEEFYLENVIEINKQHPRTFLIPSKENIDNLKIGDLIKLVLSCIKNKVMDVTLKECG